MELSAEATALIIANGGGRQGEDTQCHFCRPELPKRGKHLYVFVEAAGSAPEPPSEAGETPVAGSEAAPPDTGDAPSDEGGWPTEGAPGPWADGATRAGQKPGWLVKAQNENKPSSSSDSGPDSDSDADALILGCFGVTSLSDQVGAGCEVAQVRARGEYRGYCTHVDWDGSPWCDCCIMLGQEGGVVYPCCPKCCGVSWGVPCSEATPEQEARRCLWTPAYQAIWEKARVGGQ